MQWLDRDGTTRLTPLSQPEAARLEEIAQRLRIAKGEVLRQAAHIPVAKHAPKKSPLSENSGDSPAS